MNKFLCILAIILLCGCSSSGGGSSGTNVYNGKNCQLKFDDSLNLFANSEPYETTTSYHTVRIWNDNGGNPNGDDSGKFAMRVLVNSVIVEEFNVPNILQGGYADLYLEVDRSLYPAGVYTVTLVLDVFNKVGETNEADNQHQETVTIVGSILVNN